jgi:hypothetical protein
MRKLDPVTVSGQQVIFAIKRVPLEAGKPYAVDVIATCDAETREARLSFNPKHDKDPEQFWKDIVRTSQKLAEETVGHLKAKVALDEIFQAAPEEPSDGNQAK